MDKVEKFYDDNAIKEWKRLERHKVEFDITKRYLLEYIQDFSRILDIGGGPGRYSIFLAKRGHEVSLLDLSKENIKLARSKAAEAHVEIKEFIHANALELSEKVSGTFDIVLCMGPLYHLPEIDDRLCVIRECLKKLQPGGLIFVSFISAYAPMIDYIKNYPENIVGFKKNLLQYLKNGENIVSTDNPGFTTAYFINPADIEDLMSGFNLRKKVITGIEGLTAQSEAKINSLSDEAYEEWLDIIYQTATNQFTWGACEHILYIGEKIK